MTSNLSDEKPEDMPVPIGNMSRYSISTNAVSKTVILKYVDGKTGRWFVLEQSVENTYALAKNPMKTVDHIMTGE